MSMPTFPDEGTDITQEQAFNMLLGSIAMEELALSHIMNSEGEKLQYILGTLPSQKPPCPPTTCELLKINQSISSLLENVSHNQILLKSKLQQVLDAKEKWTPPCPPECGKERCCTHHKTWVFHQAKNGFWEKDCPFYWKLVSGDASGSCLKCSKRSTFHLNERSVYLLSYSFKLCGKANECVSVALQRADQSDCENILIARACADAPTETFYLNGCTVLSPTDCGPTPSPIRFVLLSPDSMAVENAVFSLTIL